MVASGAGGLAGADNAVRAQAGCTYSLIEVVTRHAQSAGVGIDALRAMSESRTGQTGAVGGHVVLHAAALAQHSIVGKTAHRAPLHHL